MRKQQSNRESAAATCLGSLWYCLHHRLSACLTVLLLSLPALGYGYGIAWQMPRSHFDGVDRYGNVFLAQKMGELETGQGCRLPIFAAFNSGSENRSPYAGHGWIIPFLESKMVQIDERQFRLLFPDGLERVFHRDPGNANILYSSQGWKAEIKGDTIAVCSKSACKLSFWKGRIIAVEAKEGKFNYRYDGDRVVEIWEGSRPILRVLKDPLTGGVNGLSLPNQQKILLEQSKRQRTWGGNIQNAGNGMDESLTRGQSLKHEESG